MYTGSSGSGLEQMSMGEADRLRFLSDMLLVASELSRTATLGGVPAGTVVTPCGARAHTRSEGNHTCCAISQFLRPCPPPLRPQLGLHVRKSQPPPLEGNVLLVAVSSTPANHSSNVKAGLSVAALACDRNQHCWHCAASCYQLLMSWTVSLLLCMCPAASLLHCIGAQEAHRKIHKCQGSGCDCSYTVCFLRQHTLAAADAKVSVVPGPAFSTRGLLQHCQVALQTELVGDMWCHRGQEALKLCHGTQQSLLVV